MGGAVLVQSAWASRLRDEAPGETGIEPSRSLAVDQVLSATGTRWRQAEEGTVSQGRVNGNVSSHRKRCFGRILSIRDMVSFVTREKEKQGPSLKRVRPISHDPHLAQRRTRPLAVVIDVGRGQERVVFLLCFLPRSPNSLRDQTPRG